MTSVGSAGISHPSPQSQTRASRTCLPEAACMSKEVTKVKMPAPLCPARFSTAHVWTARTAAPIGARVGAQNATEHSRMGRGGGLGVTFQDPAHPGTRSGESGTEAAASAMCSLIPPPAPCSFRFPIKTCPDGRPPRWLQPPGQSLLWFWGLSAPPSGLALDGVGPPPGPLSTSGPLSPETRGEPCLGPPHGFSQNPGQHPPRMSCLGHQDHFLK